MRLFIAIQFDREMKNALIAAQEAFRQQGVRGNYTRSENLHLTLAFIGEYSDPDRVLEAMDAAVGVGAACGSDAAAPEEGCEDDCGPIALKLDGVGAFGDLWWAGLAENAALKTLVRRLRHALAEAGIPYDRKKFSPHVTLIRRAVTGRYFRPGEIRVPRAAMRAERISLMCSTQGKHGMIYTELGAADL